MSLFDNNLIQAPDGTNLSRCSVKKARWYLSQGLAEIISENPNVIRLKFEPSGRKGLDDPLLLAGKPNLCVVCGSTDHLSRHHIIPYCFIRHMQIEYKADIIRDIFPVCRCCHDAYEIKANEKKYQMAKEAGIPLHGIPSEEMKKVRRATGSAIALLKHKDKMPLNKRIELEENIIKFLNKNQITEEDLMSLKNYSIIMRDDYVSFSKYIAQSMNDYNEFAKDWRKHFVTTMKPKYMPKEWNVDRKTENVWVPKRMLNQRTS